EQTVERTLRQRSPGIKRAENRVAEQKNPTDRGRQYDCGIERARPRERQRSLQVDGFRKPLGLPPLTFADRGIGCSGRLQEKCGGGERVSQLQPRIYPLGHQVEGREPLARKI